ncbi:MAG: VacJ family lipoprotein [Holosporaceae bacterium]|jgi:phospholipid-binding lipoprotein MlaA|nr:VacJ family lipoprotein [Holosporaceae bacterium]
MFFTTFGKNVGIVLLMFLVACSATRENPDPHRGFNKDMLEFNLMADKKVLKPAAETYQGVTSDAVREGVSNFLQNLKEPFFFVNYSLAGEAECAASSLFRFSINSTIGILGFLDIAERIGLSKKETSFKTTLKKWGVPTGDYLVLPLLGASSTRDTISEPIAWYADPVGYYIGFPYMLAKAILSTISDRAENSKIIDANLNNTMDPYFSIRSLYLQKYGTDDVDNTEDAEDNSSF